MSNLSKSDVALLQARHAYNDAKIEKVVHGGGFTMGSDDVVIRMNRMAWGLFEATILKAFKDRSDLSSRNPELVASDRECELCKGVGKFPYTPGTPEYTNAYNDFYMWEGKLELDAPPYGTDIAKFCSPCQGTGITLKKCEE